ncbi:MAG: hypothetical protein U5Q44_07205 [Dehalococcoidia bacterium]|nr:hypothetical protein [Dehalococcoidia bacterium]
MVAIEGLRGVDELIECRPDYREGRPHIAGTGVSVGRVGVLYTLEGLAIERDRRCPAAHAASRRTPPLPYYLRNRELIDADLAAMEQAEQDAIRRYGAAGQGGVASG